MTNKKCEQCKFYDKSNQSYGECHRFPPKKVFPEQEINLSIIKADDIEEPRWPFVCFDDWCGEFKSSMPVNDRSKDIKNAFE